MWVTLRQRGARSIKVTKVKGHTTEEQVEDGKVKREDKEGNDEADRAANRGVEEHTEGLEEFARWIYRRHKKYVGVVAEIQQIPGITPAGLKKKEHKKR